MRNKSMEQMYVDVQIKWIKKLEGDKYNVVYSEDDDYVYLGSVYHLVRIPKAFCVFDKVALSNMFPSSFQIRGRVPELFNLYVVRAIENMHDTNVVHIKDGKKIRVFECDTDSDVKYYINEKLLDEIKAFPVDGYRCSGENNTAIVAVMYGSPIAIIMPVRNEAFSKKV